MKKLAVLLAAAAASLLLLEGLLSLAFATSVRALLGRQEPVEDEPYTPTDRDRAAAAARTEGPFRVPADPLVGYTLKTESELVFSEDLGLRARPGPPPAEDALRIVVLGDSVAFGFGLGDEETLAAQLERQLAGPLGGRVACFTVAIPSWNARNAWRFLLVHLDRFRPDVVLYLPVENDLEDSYGVTEAGQRRAAEDPASLQPLLHVRALRAFVTLRTRELRAAGDDPAGRLGPGVIGSRLGALARARYGELADTIVRGAARLERIGARLALVSYEQSEFHRELRAELRRTGAAPVEIALLEELRRDDALADDPHPSAATTAVFATWIAASLLEHGWLPAVERSSLPAVPESHAQRRARPLEDADIEGWSRARRARQEGELRARISTATLEGILQVYGGLNLDGSMESRFAAVLPRGERVRVRLAPIDGRPDLHPLEVRVFADERALGHLSVLATGASEASFELPGGEGAFDLCLEARDWAVVTVRGKSWVASARLVELESLP
jgi:hypothetical protein